MLTASPTTRVFVAREPVDMRGSFDALAGRVRALGLDPLDGHLYVFFSRRRHMCAVLAFDRTGWCLFRKRLIAEPSWFDPDFLDTWPRPGDQPHPGGQDAHSTPRGPSQAHT